MCNIYYFMRETERIRVQIHCIRPIINEYHHNTTIDISISLNLWDVFMSIRTYLSRVSYCTVGVPKRRIWWWGRGNHIPSVMYCGYIPPRHLFQKFLGKTRNFLIFLIFAIPTILHRYAYVCDTVAVRIHKNLSGLRRRFKATVTFRTTHIHS